METDIFEIKNIEKNTDGLRMQRHFATSAIRGRRGADPTSCNLGLPAGGIRRPHLRRLTHWGRRRCGNAWSLCDISPACGYFKGKFFEKMHIFRPESAETMVSERPQHSQEHSKLVMEIL